MSIERIEIESGKKIAVETNDFQFFTEREPSKAPFYMITVKHCYGENQPRGFGFADQGDRDCYGDRIGSFNISDLLGKLSNGSYRVTPEERESFLINGLESPTDENKLNGVLWEIFLRMSNRETHLIGL